MSLHKVKILILSLNDKMGGAEQVLKMIALYYAKEGYQVDVYFASSPKGNLWNGVNDNITLHYTSAANPLPGLGKLRRLLEKTEDKYDYVFTSHIYLNSLAGLWRKKGAIRADCVIGRDSRSYFIANKGFKLWLYKFLIKRGYPYLDLLICQTEEMKTQFIGSNGKLAQKLRITSIPNPVDPDQIRRMGRSGCPVEGKYKYIISAGRLISIKGYDHLIKAFSRLDSDDLHLVILGEGEERRNLEQLIVDLHLSDRVHLPGHEDNVFPYFREAELCVVSSIKEGFPNVLLQMMSQNTNVVSTRCSGGIENINGIFSCEAVNVDSLKTAMELCLTSDTSKNRELFDEELSARSIEEFINTVGLCLEAKAIN